MVEPFISPGWDGYENTVGFQDDVKKLQKMLFRTDHQQQIFISILGDSGVGKRTVVHNIFCNKKVIDHFKIRVSYRMLPDSTTEDLLQKIYDEAHKERPQHQTDKDIAITDKLQLLLAERRYLVVISGLSSKTMLNRVRASLPDKNNGSRVVLILDIESEEVAWHANTMNKEGIKGVHLLSRLDEKRSGQLFCSRAFRKELSYEKENMNQYNKIVYDITGGYPLAIVVLAGLLRFKEKPGQWEAVLQQLRPGPRMEEEQVGAGNKIIEAVLSKEKRTEWQMISATPAANTSTKRTIERVFWASFEDLPNDLKSCFLYLAAYPKNVVLHANITVFMWIAEGFIKPQKGKIMEETGHNYIKELVLRCLLQVEEMNAAGDITKVSVHKSLHGFLHSEAREAGFIEVHDIHDAFMPPSVRRLSYQSLDGRFPIFTNKFPKLHSFICYVEYKYRTGVRENHSHDLKFLCWSNFMRLISIRGLRLDRFPDEIGDMFHLRYLRVDCKNLKKLPSSIRRLLNLQTLDIRNTQIENIDPYFWQIKVLRHVLADNLTLPSWSIKEELDELQTLHGVKPAEEGEWDQLNCPLHKMTRLRSLELHGLKRNKHKAALESALTNMHLLGNLKVKGDRIPSCVLIGQHLQNLQILVLDGIVKWPEVGWGVRKVRPNLVELTVVKHSSEEVPKHIKDELQDMLKETIAM